MKKYLMNSAGPVAQMQPSAWVCFLAVGIFLVLGRDLDASGLEYTFTTYAGPVEWGSGAVDARGSAARFSYPSGIAMDPAGNLYVTDSWNYTVRRITPEGEVRTLAGLATVWGTEDGHASARFGTPYGIVCDNAGNLYVADQANATLRKIDPFGNVSTLAGKAGVYGREDGIGGAARFSSPTGIALDSAGNLYVTEASDCTIRKVTPEAKVTTLAGLAGNQGSVDGTGTGARFSNPYGIALDRAGNLYVADCDNHTIRKITPAGVVTTVAGKAGEAGSSDGQGMNARFRNPQGVAFDSDGNLFIADSGNHLIRKMPPAGGVVTVAGAPGAQGHADGATHVARFYYPDGIAISKAGELFIADRVNCCIRKVSTNGIVSTVAGKAPGVGSADGLPAAARFYFPYGVAIDRATNLYVADTFNHTIRKISPATEISTLAGKVGAAGSADGTGGAARFAYPMGVAARADGWVYVADTSNHVVRLVSPEGVVTTLAGSPGQLGSANGSGAAARFNSPRGVAVDGAASVYVADTGNATIRKIDSKGVVTTLAGSAGNQGFVNGSGSAARFRTPTGVAVDTTGNVYVADEWVAAVRKINPAGQVTTLANWSVSGFDFYGSSGVAVDAAGTIFAVNQMQFDHIIRILPNGTWTNIAGGESGSTDGTGPAARFNFPLGVAVDPAGRLFIADASSHVIRVGVTNTCEDVPLLDSAVGPIGASRQLETEPQTAVTWEWSFTQQPVDSLIRWSDPRSPNPRFTPEEPGSYQIRFQSTNALGNSCLRTLTFTATNALWLSRANCGNNLFSVTLSTKAGQLYTLEYKDLLSASTWTAVDSVAGTGGKRVLRDTNATADMRCYRVRQP